MVDGATSNSKKVDSNDSFVPQIVDRRPQIAFNPSIRSFTFGPSHSILRHKRKDNFLRRGSNPQPSSSKLVYDYEAHTNPQDHGALAGAKQFMKSTPKFKWSFYIRKTVFNK